MAKSNATFLGEDKSRARFYVFQTDEDSEWKGDTVTLHITQMSNSFLDEEPGKVRALLAYTPMGSLAFLTASRVEI